MFILTGPKSTPKTLPSFNVSQKICSASKTEATGLDARSKAKYILKANSLPFATCFYCCRSPSLWRPFSWNLGWIGSSFQNAWQPGDPQELSADISLGLSMLRGQREPWLPGPTHSGATMSQSRRPKLKCEKLCDWRHSSPPMAFSFLCDSSSETAFSFMFLFFPPLDYLTTCEQSCQEETCLIDRARECLSQHGVKFDFLHVQYASLKPVIALAWCFLMDQLSIITCCEAKHNGNYDTCHNLLLG